MNVIVGRYINRNSWVHRLDPRMKILSLIILMIGTFMTSTLINMLWILAGVFLLILTSKISLLNFIKSLVPLLFLMTFTFVFQVLFNKQGPIISTLTLNLSFITILLNVVVIIGYQILKRFRIRGFFWFLLTFAFIIYLYTLNLGTPFKIINLNLYRDGLTFGLFLLVRIIILVSASSLLTLTTKPADLNNGLERLMKPLKVLKVPVDEMSMMISIALRFIPTLLDEVNKIMKAQASRGVDFASGNIKKKVVQIVSLLVPMFVISFKRADDLSNAMEARGYFPGMERSKFGILKFRFSDYLTILFSISFLVGIVYFDL